MKTVMIIDFTAVTERLQLYFDALYHSDTSQPARVFHPQACYVFPLDDSANTVALVPLYCAGLIGWRALVKAGPGRRVGLYGFGATARAANLRTHTRPYPLAEAGRALDDLRHGRLVGAAVLVP